jgi:hypothetical protein
MATTIQLQRVATTVTSGSYGSYIWQLRQLHLAATTVTPGSYGSYSWQLRQLHLAATTVIAGSYDSYIWQLCYALSFGPYLQPFTQIDWFLQYSEWKNNLTSWQLRHHILANRQYVRIQHSAWRHFLETGDFNLFASFLPNHLLSVQF